MLSTTHGCKRPHKHNIFMQSLLRDKSRTLGKDNDLQGSFNPLDLSVDFVKPSLLTDSVLKYS